MTTYTIAMTKPASDSSSLLLAIVPDGADIDGAAQKEIADNRLDANGPVEYVTVPGLTLTDDEPEDEDRIVWKGHSCGWLIDEMGRTYEFAVRP